MTRSRAGTASRAKAVPGPWGTAGTGGSRTQDVVPGPVVTLLARLANDPKAGAQARASAARTLAEIQGLVGRHSVKPDRTGDQPLEELTRAELVQELARLRAATGGPGPGPGG